MKFLHKLLTETHPDIETILAADRKGYRILTDCLPEANIPREIPVLSDSDMDDELKTRLTGKTVLIFDDNIHTGETIDGLIRRASINGARRIILTALASNEEAMVRLPKEKIENTESLHPFATYYPEQRDLFLAREVPLLSGLREKRSPDFPILDVSSERTSLDFASDVIISYFLKTFPGCEFQFIDSLADFRDTRSLTFDLDECNDILPQSAADMADLDCQKVRVNIVLQNEYTMFSITAMMNNGYNTDECEAYRKGVEWCLGVLLKAKNKDESTCLYCATVLTNILFLESMMKPLKKHMKKKGLKKVEMARRSPKLRRLSQSLISSIRRPS